MKKLLVSLSLLAMSFSGFAKDITELISLDAT